MRNPIQAAAVILFGLSAMALQAAHAADASPKVEKLPSGVTVTHVKVGTGPKPSADNTVKVHYEGTLQDGKVFDSSYKRGEPISFPLKRVIPCWTEGVQTMQVGGKATLHCPSKTAYGAAGAGGVIPPNADLTFTVELLGIER